MSLPALLPNGYLPPGVHEATLSEVVERFGTNTPRRQVLASRLQELVSLARAPGKPQRIFIWGGMYLSMSRHAYASRRISSGLPRPLGWQYWPPG
jgi:hypothetical protein